MGQGGRFLPQILFKNLELYTQQIIWVCLILVRLKQELIRRLM